MTDPNLSENVEGGTSERFTNLIPSISEFDILSHRNLSKRLDHFISVTVMYGRVAAKWRMGNLSSSGMLFPGRTSTNERHIFVARNFCPAER
jgi:hypothetical protein